MRKVLNFNAGPSMLPEEVLKEAEKDMLDWQDTGMSIMELSHRGEHFKKIADKSTADLRELMAIPDNYHILFLAGGATTQFSMVPLNLLGNKKQADYVNTGLWSKKAIDEAKRYGKVNIVAQTAHEDELAYIPPLSTWHMNPDAAYLHYTPNETIAGIEFNWVPKTNDVPLVADMSSMILSRPIEVSAYGLIYACAQKNLGQAGITVVIIRDDLVHEAHPLTPALYQYKLQVENHSFYNTPPTYSWYICGLMLQWIKRQGGVSACHAINQQKAKLLYDFIDEQAPFYQCNIRPDCRSLMNVVFTLKGEPLINQFLAEAKDAGLCNLKGHRLVGGVRASIYNAMPLSGVQKLVNFMADFKKRNE